MKLKLILENVNEVDFSIIPDSKLELELSQANVFETGSGGGSNIPNTDYLPEGLINKYFDENKVRFIVNEMLPVIPSTTTDITEGENKYFTSQRAVEALAPQLETKLNKIDYVQHFRGLFGSYSNLVDVLPSALDGDYAHIDSGSGFDRMVAIWDSSDGKWIVKEVNVASSTDEIAEGLTNLYFKSDRVLKTPLTAPTNNNTPVTANDALMDAISKLQSQINYLKANPPAPSPVVTTWYKLTDVSTTYTGISDGAGYPVFATLEFAKVNGFLYVRGGFSVVTSTPTITLKPEWKVRAIFSGNVNSNDMAPNLQTASSAKPSAKMVVRSGGTVINDTQAKTVSQIITTIDAIPQNVNCWMDGAVCLGQLITP